MLEDCQPSLIVTNDKNHSLARKLAPDASQLINIDEIDSNLYADSLDPSISPDSLTWIIFTSGSTGKPKGVMQTHRNVLQEIMNRRTKKYSGLCRAKKTRTSNHGQ
jgi:long-subunit acyl-CoA synthetase (AMP-forming)